MGIGVSGIASLKRLFHPATKDVAQVPAKPPIRRMLENAGCS